MADIADGAVAVVSRDRNQHRRAARTVAFEHDFVDLAAFQFAGAAHDGALDVVGRHADSLGGKDGRAQTRIRVGIAAAPGGDHDFFNDAGEDFPALGVEGALLVLDGRPFGMTGHTDLWRRI